MKNRAKYLILINWIESVHEAKRMIFFESENLDYECKGERLLDDFLGNFFTIPCEQQSY